MTTAFTVFDLRNFATTQPLRMILPLALIVVFGATLPIPGVPIVIGAMIASITVSYYFQGDERGLLDTLYATSAVSRRAVVIGRYLSALVFAAVSVGLGSVTTLVMSTIRHQNLGWPLIIIMLLAAFSIVALALAVQLPWFFAMGFTRGRPMIYIPVGIITIVGFIAGQTGLLDGSMPVTLPRAFPTLAVILVLALGGAAVVASAAIAVRLYQNREL